MNRPRRAYFAHLARRLAGSLSPTGPPADEEAWARSLLLEGEQALWARMRGPDRRHAVAAARRAEARLGGTGSREVLAGALLHDVGKLASGLGTMGRVAATLLGMAAGGRPLPARVELYLNHAEVGGELLERAGSHPLTVAWARQHHLPPSRSSLPPHLAEVLKAADDD